MGSILPGSLFGFHDCVDVEMMWQPGEIREYAPLSGGCCFCLRGAKCRYRRSGDMKNGLYDRLIAPALAKVHIEQMAELGFSSEQSLEALAVGLDMGNFYHRKAMIACAALGEIDGLLKHPEVWIKGMLPSA